MSIFRDRVGNPLFLLLTATFGVAFLMQGLLLSHRQSAALELAFQREVAAVQEITGAILSGHPELESELAELLRERDPAHRELGAGALARYGWHTGRSYLEETHYRSVQAELSRHNALLFLIGCLFCGCACGWLVWRGHTNTKYFALVLEDYLSGDFSFAATIPTGRRSGSRALQQDTLRRLGNQIRLDQTRLTEEKESTKALVTDVSHQLKTPVAALKICFSLLLEAENASEQQEFQDRCLLQMDKLEALTTALMNISRLEAAMITLRPEPADLRDLLMQAVGGIFDKAADKNIAIQLAEFEPILLELDRRWTTEAVMNVLDNAVKYSPADTQIRIAVQQRQSYVRVEISDEGIGVPREERSRIFQRFYRGSHDIVRFAEGAGVGLYLTRAILEGQGGSIHVRPNKGQGSTFVIQLYLNL